MRSQRVRARTPARPHTPTHAHSSTAQIRLRTYTPVYAYACARTRLDMQMLSKHQDRPAYAMRPVAPGWWRRPAVACGLGIVEAVREAVEVVDSVRVSYVCSEAFEPLMRMYVDEPLSGWCLTQFWTFVIYQQIVFEHICSDMEYN
eukprot:910358-Pleurochrysis_carterae.AAC.10